MARTKQTARRSTGGKNARLKLQQVASKIVNDPIESVCCEIGGNSWSLTFAGGRKRTVSESEAKSMVEPISFYFCHDNEGMELSAKHATWWGLLDKEVEVDGKCMGSLCESPWTISEVRFNPGIGAPTDRCKGGFEGRPGKRDKEYPVRLFTLCMEKNKHNLTVSEDLKSVFQDCIRNRMKWISISGLGSRPVDLTNDHLFHQYEVRSHPILYQSSRYGGCVAMAAANCLHREDLRAASVLSSFKHEAYNMSRFSCLLRTMVRTWSLEKPFSIELRRGGRPPMTGPAKLSWLLEREEGLYLVQPVNKQCGNNHVVGVDCSEKLIYDALQKFPLKLSKVTIGLCAGGGSKYIGIGELRELKKLPEKSILSKRCRRSRRGKKIPKLPNFNCTVDQDRHPQLIVY